MKIFKKLKELISDDKFLLFTIILAGALLRLYRIRDYMVFLGDEGRDMLVIYNILHGHLTLLGPTASVGGFFLGPIYYYMITPFLWLSNYDPVGPSIMVALFGLATIVLVYKIGKEFFNKATALIASLLFAVSPIVVSFSRSSWNPNVMPFFTLATLYTLYKGVLKKSLPILFVSGVLFGVTMQIHYLATFVGVIIFLYLTILGLRGKYYFELAKQYATYFFGFVIGLSPFFMFEARHDFTNTRNVINFVFKSGETGAGGNFFNIVGLVLTRLFGGLVLSFPLKQDFFFYQDNILSLWLLISFLIAILSVGYFLFRFIKDKDKFSKFLIIFLWFFIGVILFGFYKKPIYDYYLGFMFPLPFLLVGFYFSHLLKRSLTKFTVPFLLVFMVVLSLAFSHQRAEPNRMVDQTKAISDFVLQKTAGKPYNFALLARSNSDSAYRYFFTLEQREPVAIIPPGVDPERKSVTDQLFVICEDLPCKPLGHPLWEIAGFGQADLGAEWDVSVVKVYKLIHAK